jgi:uncharacterized MAPEG superfamily protein
MPVAYWCVLVAAILPLVWVGYAKSGGSNNQYPREDYEDLTPPRRRAYAAHQNAYDNFPFFAVAVIVAMTLGANPGTVNLLAVLYILARIAHGALYIANKSSLRSAVYMVGFFLNIAIFVLPAFK